MSTLRSEVSAQLRRGTTWCVDDSRSDDARRSLLASSRTHHRGNVLRSILPAFSISFLALSIGSFGCHGTADDIGDVTQLAKVSPATVSITGAWGLFDRSIESGFVPDGDVVKATLDAPEQLSAVKIFGPSPYRLRITGRDGGSLGFAPIDLSKLRSGWNVIESSSLVATSSVELRFEALNKSEKLPEIELWAVSDATERTERVDLAAKDLPQGFVTLQPADATAEPPPGECASFEFDLTRASSTFVKAYLAYDAVGMFRNFALSRSINGLADQGGAWLGDASQTKRTFVEQIDPTVLHTGRNEVQLCVPGEASRAVAISNLRVIGELDRGVGIVSSVTLGDDDQGVAALHDGDDETKRNIERGELAILAFDRLTAPDALVVAGTNLDVGLVGSVECVGRKDKSEAVAAKPARKTTSGLVIELEGGAKRCVALAVTFAAGASVADVDVIGSGAAERVDWPRVVVTSQAEHFGGRGWVAGFIARPAIMSGPIRVEVAGKAAESLLGDFGRLLERTTDLAVPWPVVVTAKYPDGTKEAKQIVLNGDASAQLAAATSGATASGVSPDLKEVAKFGRVGESVSARASMIESTVVRLGTRVGVSIPYGAVLQPTKITARHLGTAALPPLDPGMINVTAPKGRGYEFLPHGQRFAKPVEVSVPFDPRLIPDGMSADDVHTYYFDTTAKRWRKLDRKEIDSREQVIRSTSDHFTIMIDAVLAVPTNSAPLSFDPSSMSSIGPADPGANIDFVEVAGASSTGDARLSLPIRLPPGRGAFSPSLGINYSSAADSSWLGVGWNLTTSRIEIDTRWGVPTYADGEEVRYMLDGEALVPTLDSDGPTCSGGGTGRRYHARVEGNFTHILRCGSNPSNYYFELRDRNGTRFVYGSKVAGNTGNAWLRSSKTRPCGTQPCGNGIFSWGLQQVVDVHGNTTTYTYQNDNPSGAEPGRQVYPLKITYTSHASKPAAYSVDFVLDTTSRKDVIVNGRGGFKMVTRRLLRAVRVNFGSERIREYLLTYEPGQFQKTRLKSVQVYGLGGCASPGMNAFTAPTCSGAAFLDEHTFGYWTEEAGFVNSVDQWPVQWTSPNPQPANMTLGKGNTKTTTASVSMDVGSSEITGSVGANYSLGARNESVGFYDVNGDGLPDQLFQTENGPVVPIYNHGGYFDNVGPALDQAALGSERQSSWGITADVGLNVGPFNASATGGYASSTSRANRFLTDLDGDGFIDLLAAQAKRSEPCPTGHCFKPLAFSALSQVNPAADPALNDIASELDQQHMTGDPVLRWVAPYSGQVSIHASFSMQNAGDVSVGLYLGDTLLPGWPKPLTGAGASISVDHTLQIAAGDTLYAKIETGTSDGIVNTTLNDVVLNGTSITYDSVCRDAKCSTSVTYPLGNYWPYTALEPTNEEAFWFSFNAHTSPGGAAIVAPVQGQLELSGWLHKSQRSAADLRVCVQRFPAGTTQTDFGCNDPNSPATKVIPTWNAAQGVQVIQGIGGQFNVNAGDLIVLRLESDFSFEPYSVWFEKNGPVALKYTSACIPNDNGVGCTTTTDPAVLSDLPIDQNEIGLFIAPTTPPEPLGALYEPAVAWATELWKIYPFPNPQGNRPITIAFRSNKKGTFLVFDCNTTTCAPPGATPTTPFTIDAPAGEAFSFEVLAEKVEFPAVTTSLSIIRGTTPNGAPWIFRNKRVEPKPPSPFAGGRRGFSATFWNERILFEPSRLLADYANPSGITFERGVEIASTAIAPRPLFEGLVGRSWVAPGSVAFVKQRGVMHAAKVGVTPPGLPGELADPRGDLFSGGYGRLSATTSWFLGGSASLNTGNKLPIIAVGGSVGGTATRSRTLTTTDVVDVTGDGIADVVAPNRCFAGNLSGATANQASIQFGDAFRRRKGVNYMMNVGATASIPRSNAAGRFLYAVSGKTNTGGLGGSTGLGLSRSETVQDLIDINGDGLVDDVKRIGNQLKVRYNFGTSLGAEETIGVAAIPAVDGFQSFEGTNDPYGENYNTTADALEHSTTLTQHDNISVGFLWFKYQYSKRLTSSRISRRLSDINGDGLPDILHKANGQPIKVQFNLGNAFSTPAVSWTGPAWTVPLSPSLTSPLWNQLNLVSDDALTGTSSEVGTSHAGSISVPWIPGVLSSTIGLARSNDTDTFELSLVDINGDGNADHVLRRGQGANNTIYVKRNKLGKKANLLALVRRPMGGTINLAYGTMGNTVQMPQQRAVLTRVEVDDGFDLGPDFASPNAVTLYSYDGGYYHRNEKEFYGFAKVTTTRADGVTVEQQYNNTDYWKRGRLAREIVRDPSATMPAQTLSNHVITYDVRPVMDGSSMPLIPDPACIAALHPLLQRVGADACTTKWPVVVRDDNTYASIVSKTHTTQDASFDRFGNVLVSTDAGDDSTTTDDLYVSAGYSNDTTRWILGRPTSVEVRAQTASGQILRSRAGIYNTFGNPRTINVATGTATATTTLDYDTFGNLKRITTPPNHVGQTQTYDVMFDSTTATYPITTTDGFGYTSSAAYDLRFGVATTETDTNGNQITRTLDAFGRVATVRGPYDTATAPGIEMQYYPNEPRPRAVTIARPSAPATYTGPLPGATTAVTIADGLGRVVEMRKTAMVGTAVGMTTSGLVQRDLLGRVTRSYQPFFTAGASTVFITPQLTLANATRYDNRDRIIQVTYPDGVSESTNYAVMFSPVPAGGFLFRRQIVDANGHTRESYDDHLGRTRAYVEHPSSTETSVTSYHYRATGELVQITDPAGAQTQIDYDLRGLRTSLMNPDTGWIQDTYDLMGNRTATIEPNHQALGTQVSFKYDRDRLASILYPSDPDPSTPTIVFEYGAPGAANGRAGRLAKVYDKTGSQEYYYGALGEQRRTVRNVTDPQMVFDLKLTSDSFGRQLEIVYPDGEIVRNTYNAGGLLASVTGTGNGWSRVYADQILYDAFGAQTQVRFGNGVVSSWQIQPERRRLVELKTKLPSTQEIQKLRFGYDPGGNPTQIDNVLGPMNGTMPGFSSLTLAYDGVDRLIHATGSASLDAGMNTSYDQVFEYTPSHAIKRKQRAHQIFLPWAGPWFPPQTNFNDTFTYSTRPHLPSKIGALNVQYDPSGNPTHRYDNAGISQTLVWDDDNTLVQFETGTARQINSYDANGLRVVRKTNDGHTTVFSSPYFDVEDGSQGVKHIFGGPIRLASALGGYVSGTDPVPPAEPAVAYYLHGDNVGSTTVVTDEVGGIHESREYFVDGESWIDRAPTTTVNKYLFNGKPFDSVSGFYDFGQRFYDPRTSLWLGIDPLFIGDPGRSIGRPDVLAPSGFVGNSPVRNKDPNGLDFPRTDAGKHLYGQTMLHAHYGGTEFYDPPGFNWDTSVGTDPAEMARRVDSLKPATIRGGINASIKATAPAAALTVLLAAALPADVAIGLGVGFSGAELIEGIWEGDPWKIVRGGLGLGAAGLSKLAPAPKGTPTPFDTSVVPPVQVVPPVEVVPPTQVTPPAQLGAVRPAQPYDRSLYGGRSATRNPVANALVRTNEGQPCPSCTTPQISGTRYKPSAEHEPPLIEHYYEYGGHLMTQAQREAYASSPEAFNGTQCLRCQCSQGNDMKELSRFWKTFWGL